MSEDQFTKLFKYIQKIDKKTDYLQENSATKFNIERLLAKIDSCKGTLDTMH